jgi:hypothetical protein
MIQRPLIPECGNAGHVLIVRCRGMSGKGGVWATREKERGRFGGSDERLRRSGDDHIGSKLVLFVQTVLQRYRVIVC